MAERHAPSLCTCRSCRCRSSCSGERRARDHRGQARADRRVTGRPISYGELAEAAAPHRGRPGRARFRQGRRARHLEPEPPRIRGRRLRRRSRRRHRHHHQSALQRHRARPPAPRLGSPSAGRPDRSSRRRRQTPHEARAVRDVFVFGQAGGAEPFSSLSESRSRARSIRWQSILARTWPPCCTPAPPPACRRA